MILERPFIRNWQNIMHNFQLFCYTYAGGSASFFDDIDRDLNDIDVIKFEYAGHGTRHRERFYKDFTDLAEDAFHALQATLNGDQYALFGYSMGCISLVELLKIIIRNNTPLPKHIFLGAHDPITRKELQGLTTEELDDWVKKRTIAFGAIPDSLINNNAFWRTYLPIYRADYEIIGKHRFEDVELRVDIPVTIFYSEKDTPLTKMRLWENYFKGDIDYYQFDGPHFFLKQYHQDMAAVISNVLKQVEDL